MAEKPTPQTATPEHEGHTTTTSTHDPDHTGSFGTSASTGSIGMAGAGALPKPPTTDLDEKSKDTTEPKPPTS